MRYLGAAFGDVMSAWSDLIGVLGVLGLPWGDGVPLGGILRTSWALLGTFCVHGLRVLYLGPFWGVMGRLGSKQGL